MAASGYPEDLKYTSDHEWVKVVSDSAVRIGITDFAAEALGDVVFVSLPAVGLVTVAGESCGEVESTKSVSDLYSPVSGTVSAVNEALDTTPELVNADPYGEGWMYEVDVEDMGTMDALMSASEYADSLS